MSTLPLRRRRIDANDDDAWNLLAREAAARLPDNLTPPMSEVSDPTKASSVVPVVSPVPTTSPAVPRFARTRKVRKPKTTRYLNITRMDYDKSHGYFVRVRWKGIARSKLFSDGVYGDRLSALSAAIEWRDQITQELGKPRPGQPPAPNIGIHRRMRDGKEVYEATWSVNGKRGRTTYSIEKHGAKKARALAVAARQRAMSRSAAEE